MMTCARPLYILPIKSRLKVAVVLPHIVDKNLLILLDWLVNNFVRTSRSKYSVIDHEIPCQDLTMSDLMDSFNSGSSCGRGLLLPCISYSYKWTLNLPFSLVNLPTNEFFVSSAVKHARIMGPSTYPYAEKGNTLSST
jgi:hypothetical protein